MKDQVDALRANGLAADFINSSLPPTERRRVETDALDGRLKILYVAPERLAPRGGSGPSLDRLDVEPYSRRRGALHIRVGPRLPS